jgi:hypothetical protein|tara:strand:- start:192 stop:308 length:117 start_codon:yes stop_codon:yes gene_type:complete
MDRLKTDVKRLDRTADGIYFLPNPFIFRAGGGKTKLKT